MGERCIKETKNLMQYCNDKGYDSRVKGLKMLEKFAVEHFEPIQKFGRYPTRNKALGRETTA